MENRKEKTVLFYFFIISLFIHMFLPLNWADDKLFFEKAAQTDLLSFISGSARPLTDSMTYIFAKCPLLWRILNPLLLTLFAKTLSVLLPTENIEKNKLNLYLCVAVVFPAMVVVDAGFIATTVNYLWPFTFGLISLVPLKKLFNRSKLRFYEYLLSILLLLYAVNMQQTAALLFAVFLTSVIYLYFQRNYSFYPLSGLLISGAGSIFMFAINTVGDNNRMVRETARYFPDFAQLSIFEKAELGFSSTFYCMTMEIRFAFFAFAAFTLYIMIKSLNGNEKIVFKLFSAFPFVFTIVFGTLSLTPVRESAFWAFISGGMKHYRMTKAAYSFDLVPFLLFICVAVCVIVSLYRLLSPRKFAAAFVILASGLASRIIMGFSPTVWASGYRTFFILFTAFIAVVAIIADTSRQPSTKNTDFVCYNTQKTGYVFVHNIETETFPKIFV